MKPEIKQRYDKWLDLIESEDKRKEAVVNARRKWEEAEGHINISRTEYLKFEILSYLFEAEVVNLNDIVSGQAYDVIDSELDWILEELMP